MVRSVVIDEAIGHGYRRVGQGRPTALYRHRGWCVNILIEDTYPFIDLGVHVRPRCSIGLCQVHIKKPTR
jgi:hypothetical protein